VSLSEGQPIGVAMLGLDRVVGDGAGTASAFAVPTFRTIAASVRFRDYRRAQGGATLSRAALLTLDQLPIYPDENLTEFDQTEDGDVAGGIHRRR